MNQEAPCHGADYNRPGVHANILSFRSSTERFGICPLPASLKQMLNIVSSDPRQEQEMTARELVSLSAFRLLKAPRSADVVDQYYLSAERQGTKYAVLPVHISEERKLFKTLHQNNFPVINYSVWIEFAKAWSAHVDGVEVF